MATLNQISDYIIGRLGKPTNNFLKQEVKFAVRNWRAFLIRQDVERNGGSREFFQRFTIALEKVDFADTCVVNIGCTVLKTTRKIPKPIRLKQPIPFRYVGTLDGSVSFTHTDFEELKFTRHNKYTSDVIRYNYINNYIYVYGNTRIKNLTVEGIFVNPNEAVTLCADSSCITDDDPFPIGDDMLKTLIEGILNGDFKTPVGKQIDNQIDVLTNPEEETE